MATRTVTANGTGGSKWIRKDLRLAVYLRDGLRCAYCGRDLAGAAAAEVTLDHLTPGHDDHRPTNLVCACRSCNSSRQDTPLSQWIGAERARKVRSQARRSVTRWRAVAKTVLAVAAEERPAVVARALAG
jgi:hypothetical protein